MTQRSAERRNAGKRAAAVRRAELDGGDWAAAFPGDITPKDLALELSTRFPRIGLRYWIFMRGALKWVESQPIKF